jgi:hypothetical protein
MWGIYIELPNMRDNVSQLLSPLFLSLSLIPNDILRYSALGIASLALIYVLHLRRPSVQLSQLNDKINKKEETTFTWKKYRLISRDIADCAKGVKKIRTTVQVRACIIGTHCTRIKKSPSIAHCRSRTST